MTTTKDNEDLPTCRSAILSHLEELGFNLKQNFDPVDPFEPPMQYTVPSQLHRPVTKEDLDLYLTLPGFLKLFILKNWQSIRNPYLIKLLLSGVAFGSVPIG